MLCRLLLAASPASALGIMPASIPALPIAGSAVSTVDAMQQSSATVLSSSAGPSFQNALAWIIQSASSSTAANSSRFLIGPGLPTLPKALLEKIQRWEYVDMTELLPTSSADDSTLPANGTPARFSLFPGCEIIRPKKRQIHSIAQWVQGFAVYMAAIVVRHPSAVLELLAYMLTIIKASQQYDGMYWRAYDTHYRISAAATGNKNWSRLDTDLYTRFFTGRAKLVNACSQCDSTAHSSFDCPLSDVRKGLSRKRPIHVSATSVATSRKKPKSWPTDVCAEFNARGSCSFEERCKFRHVCGDCSRNHPAKLCPSKAQ